MSPLGNGLVHGNLSVPFAFDKVATRGIVKIGLEAAAFQLGDEFALQPQFNAIRDFVVKGLGQRRAIMLQSPDLAYWHQLNVPTFTATLQPYIRFRLAIIDFIVDLTEAECLTDKIEAECRTALGETGWHLIPDPI